MRALITGGAGFIGSHLAEELLSRGQVVRIPGFGLFGPKIRKNHRASFRDDGLYCYPAFCGSQALRFDVRHCNVDKADVDSFFSYGRNATKLRLRKGQAPLSRTVYMHQQEIRRAIRRQAHREGYDKPSENVVRVRRRRG